MHNRMMDNNSYNIIMALASNLEALEAYHKYANDGNQQLWQQLAQSAEQSVRLLQQALPQAMQQSSQSQSQSATQGNVSSSSGTMNSGNMGSNQTTQR